MSSHFHLGRAGAGELETERPWNYYQREENILRGGGHGGVGVCHKKGKKTYIISQRLAISLLFAARERRGGVLGVVVLVVLV